MSDVFTKKKRSAVMSAIRAKDTKPEVIVRRLLKLMGYRFRLHVPELPGKPDIVIPRLKTIVEVKGCFWHGHSCLKGRVPDANQAYWRPKILGNKARGKRNVRRLRARGWKVKNVWECRIRRSTPEELYSELRSFLGPSKGNRVPESSLRKLDRPFAAIKHRKRTP